LIAFIEV